MEPRWLGIRALRSLAARSRVSSGAGRRVLPPDRSARLCRHEARSGDRAVIRGYCRSPRAVAADGDPNRAGFSELQPNVSFGRAWKPEREHWRAGLSGGLGAEGKETR